jgi:phage-related tail fiber protein
MAEEIIVTTDSRPYKSIITDIGNAKMAQAILEGAKVNIVEMRLGDGGGAYYMPTTAATALVNEVWSGEIANKSISDLSPNIIAVKAVIPSSVGGFTIREAGLFDDDGDLIAVCNMPEIAKATLPDGISSKLDIVMNILLSNTEAVEFVINPTLDPASMDDLTAAIEAHNADPNAHGGDIGGGGKATVIDIVIPKDGWAATDSQTGDDAESGDVYVDIPIEGVTAEMYPDLAIYKADLETARLCGFSTAVRTIDGALRVYAQTEPSADMRATLKLVGASDSMPTGSTGSSTTTGTATVSAASIGDGLTYTSDGKIAVKTGDGLAIDDDGAVAVTGTTMTEETTTALAEAIVASEESKAALVEALTESDDTKTALAGAVTETDENAAAMIDEVFAD